MSGHSKWSQIKHKKAAMDAKRGELFGKIARALAIAAKGNPDPSTNLHLKREVERARAANMPTDKIDRAIRRISETSDNLSELQLEFISPGNVGVIVRVITDNSNRTITELKQLASKLGVHMVAQGAASWMFKRKNNSWTPVTMIPVQDASIRQVLDRFLNALDTHDDVQGAVTNADYKNGPI